MTANGWLQIALFCAIVVAITRPLGGYMTRVFAGERTFLSRILGPVERGIYRLCGVDETVEQHWLTYAVAMLLFSLAGFVILYALQRLQGILPFNPQGQVAIEPSSAFNTSLSFVTNTNWQSYVPETTMSYLVQMAGLTVHNFVSAATGIALALALVRGFTRHDAVTVGNFWVDLTRATLYLLGGRAYPLRLEFTKATSGVDPDWSIWYAGRLLEQGIEKLLDATLLKSDLIYLLVLADKTQTLDAPGAKWERYYADFLLRRYVK